MCEIKKAVNGKSINLDSQKKGYRPGQLQARDSHAARQAPKCGPRTFFSVDIRLKNAFRDATFEKMDC